MTGEQLGFGFEQMAEELGVEASHLRTQTGPAGHLFAWTSSEPVEDASETAILVFEEQNPGWRGLEFPLELINLAFPAPAQPVDAVEMPALHEEQLTLRDYLRRTLRRLVRMNKIGEAHTRMGYFWRSTPPHLKGRIKTVLDALIEDGYVRPKPTLKEMHVSLEPQRLPEVLRFIEQGDSLSERVEDLLNAE